MSRAHSRSSGFVLLEAVVALAIIGLVAVAVLGATASQVRTADKAQTLLIARALAEDRLAAVRSLDHYGLTDVPDSIRAGSFPAPFEAYSWRLDVERIDDEYDLFTVGIVVNTVDDAFPLHTLLHEPEPRVAAEPTGSPSPPLPPPPVSR